MKQSYITIAREQILTVVYSEHDDTTIYIPLKPLVKQLGLNWTYHRQAITSSFLGEDIRTLPVTRTKPTITTKNLLCLPIEQIFGWIFRLKSGRMAPEKREKIVAFQKECYAILGGDTSLQWLANPNFNPIEHEWPSWQEPFLTSELLDQMSLNLFGITIAEHRKKKGLNKHASLSQNMVHSESVFCMLAHETYRTLKEDNLDAADEALAIEACESVGQTVLKYQVEISSAVTTADTRGRRKLSSFKNSLTKLDSLFS